MSKKKLIFRVLFALALIICIGGCATWGYYDAVMGFFKETSKASISDNNEDLVQDDDIINILVVGSDRRENENANERSDSTMIATLDMHEKKIKITSLMRDMYINIPGHGMDKFNSSYSYGGVELLAETITSNFGIKLDGYVIVDFSSFKKVINEIDGVDIELTEEEVAYLNNTGAEDTGFILGKKYRNVKVGKNTLNGSQALAYSRIRKVTNPKLGDGDFGRCMRQQYVIQQILKKIKKQSTGDVLSIATSMMSDVSTDLNSAMIQRLVRTIMKLDSSKIESLRLPYEGTYLMGRRNGMFVFIINLEANAAKLKNFIYGMGDNDADYSTDFGDISESASDGSSESKSYQEDSEIYSTHSTRSAPATSSTSSTSSTHRSTSAPSTTAPSSTASTKKPTTEAPATTATPKPTTEAPTATEAPSESGQTE
ncbi:MAG: LCP family protein [Lachnospiraceae bacterium]|nr:LCP family protein [Lachnospiraceae bacterium]